MLLVAGPIDDRPYVRIEVTVVPPDEHVSAKIQAAVNDAIAGSNELPLLVDIVAAVDRATRV